MRAVTATVPALRQAKVTFSAEALVLLTAAVLLLTVLAFFFGRWAERTRRSYWGDEASSNSPPGLARPEPLPRVKMAEAPGKRK